ncbi:MAG: tetratricopeptide repeat protein [Methylocystaceae bacterium]|nr:tetratricopeptide repeat protein [Methylocystaceae bacterium]
MELANIGKEFWDWLGTNSTQIGIIGLFVSGLWAFYLYHKKNETRSNDPASLFDLTTLEHYHKLIEEKAEWASEKTKLISMIEHFLLAIQKHDYPREQWEELFIKLADAFVEKPDIESFDVDEHVKALLKKAEQTFEAGHPEDADALLQQAELDHKKNAALLRAQRGYYQYLAANLPEAAHHFEEAANIIGTSDTDQAYTYLYNAADALYDHGLYKGMNDALVQSINLWEKALTFTPRSTNPTNWAGTQNNLGNALLNLGKRESGTQHLEDAITAYRLSLKEYTQERTPLDWAMTQNNLGNALLALGRHESGTQHLEDAVTAYRLSLKEYTQERTPLQWAATQNNYGYALATLAERKQNVNLFKKALDAYDLSLKERTQSRVPLAWAQTQENMGVTYTKMFHLSCERPYVDQAREKFEFAMEEYEKAGASYYVETLKNNMAILEQEAAQ